MVSRLAQVTVRWRPLPYGPVSRYLIERNRAMHMEDDDTSLPPSPESLLPYDLWAQEAMRGVAVRALQYAAEQGIPGQHHFYVSFRTDQAGMNIPKRLLAQYPEEMTIVLQHQFWDLRVDEPAGLFSVGLSFGGIASTLVVPFAALTAFADPHAQFGLRFRAAPVEAANSEELEEPEDLTPPAPAPAPLSSDEPQVVSLDAFRKRKD
jgi:hypothetical protein